MSQWRHKITSIQISGAEDSISRRMENGIFWAIKLANGDQNYENIDICAVIIVKNFWFRGIFVYNAFKFQKYINHDRKSNGNNIAN